jgi:hypothetical protein
MRSGQASRFDYAPGRACDVGAPVQVPAEGRVMVSIDELCSDPWIAAAMRRTSLESASGEWLRLIAGSWHEHLTLGIFPARASTVGDLREWMAMTGEQRGEWMARALRDRRAASSEPAPSRLPRTALPLLGLPRLADSVEGPCSATEGPCSWLIDDEPGGAWDAYCNNCFRPRDWTKAEREQEAHR